MIDTTDRARTATPAGSTSTGGPGAATGPRPVAPSSRIRLGWALAAAGLFLLTVVLVLWAIGSASDRTRVLTIVRAVPAGQQVTSDAVGVGAVSSDDGFGRIYVESQRDDVIGSVAAVDLAPGDLIGPSVLTGAPAALPGERLVGAVLRAGRYPIEVQRGDTGVAITSADPSAETAAEPVDVRLVSVSISETDEAAITMAVASADADLVARWAGTDQLVLTVVPLGSGS
ncbi:hypothetical protein [Ilumatobacter sp.]|uniref:hypothetical protein n=1 Tax=Ilumatobacter sp. TaxID=1967498 RepID=UPI003B51CBF3